MSQEKDVLLKSGADFIRLWKTPQNQHLAEKLAAAIDAVLIKSNKPHWTPMWISPMDRLPPLGEEVIVAGTLLGISGVCRGFGRYGAEGDGLDGKSRRWVCWPAHLAVQAWMPFPHAPDLSISQLASPMFRVR